MIHHAKKDRENIMKQLRIYLDTSVISFLEATDSPDFRKVTEDFFASYADQNELYGSDVLLRELDCDPDETRRQSTSLSQSLFFEKVSGMRGASPLKNGFFNSEFAV